MIDPTKVRIYGVRINAHGEVTETWEREGFPLQVRGVLTGHIGRVEGDGAFAESERGQFQAIDTARMLIAHQAKEANGGLRSLVWSSFVPDLDVGIAEIKCLAVERPRYIDPSSDEGFAIRKLRGAASRGRTIVVESECGSYMVRLQSRAVKLLLSDKTLVKEEEEVDS